MRHWIQKRMALIILVLVATLTPGIGTAVATAQNRTAGAASSPRISGVTFKSQHGSDPDVFVVGTGFGAQPPKAFPASCGGNLYGNHGLWFLENWTNFQAGKGTASGGNCSGIVVVSWSGTAIHFFFPPSPDIGPGDNFVIVVKGYYWGGIIVYS